MLNRRQFLLLIASASLLSACGGGGGSTSTPTAGNPLVSVDSEGNTSVDTTTLTTQLNTLPLQSLSEQEQQSLLFMREEEKLAHDVYIGLYRQWLVPVFNNIANSELTHTESVRTLLDRYALADPAANTGEGVFINTSLQILYNDLLAQGSRSLVDGLKVGAVIEEIDILDLASAMTSIDNEDMLLVYAGLMKGSRNHLRSFVSQLQRQGVNYVPHYLSQADYDAIVNSPIETGH